MVRQLTAFLVTILSASSLHAAEFFCSAGDVTCLIAAINQANSTSEEDTINLAAGIYALTVVDHTSAIDGASGLPSITGAITIKGVEGETTIIEREPSAPFFRLVHVAETGSLTLEDLTLRGGVIRLSSERSRKSRGMPTNRSAWASTFRNLRHRVH